MEPVVDIDTEAGSRYRFSMARRIELRDVPDDVHRKLEARAAQEGLSLPEYLLVEMKKIADRPTMAEMLERLASREVVNPRESAVDIIRENRNSR